MFVLYDCSVVSARITLMGSCYFDTRGREDKVIRRPLVIPWHKNPLRFVDKN